MSHGMASAPELTQMITMMMMRWYFDGFGRAETRKSKHSFAGADVVDLLRWFWDYAALHLMMVIMIIKIFEDDAHVILIVYVYYYYLLLSKTVPPSRIAGDAAIFIVLLLYLFLAFIQRFALIGSYLFGIKSMFQF